MLAAAPDLDVVLPASLSWRLSEESRYLVWIEILSEEAE